MPSALLNFLSVMSRSRFSVLLLAVPAAGYGYPLPYLKSFFFYLPYQLVATRHNLLPFVPPDSYRKILWTARSFASALELSRYPPLQSFPRLPVLSSGFSPHSVYDLLPASCHICSYSFSHSIKYLLTFKYIK